MKWEWSHYKDALLLVRKSHCGPMAYLHQRISCTAGKRIPGLLKMSRAVSIYRCDLKQQINSHCGNKVHNLFRKHKNIFTFSIFIIPPPAQRSCWGGILVSLRPSVRPSVCPSVRPSVPHAVSALYHLQLWMDSFHIRHKWSLPWEGVSCTMTFDLDLYLQGHLALT